MSFEGEFASYKPLARILANPRVVDVINRCKRRDQNQDTSNAASLVVAATAPSDFLPNLVLAIDGSYHQVAVDNGFPAAELACLTAAAVLIDLQKQRELDVTRPVNPKDFRATQGTTAIDCALPGCNVILDEPTPQASFRRQFYEASSSARLFEDGETLLETYEALLQQRTGGDQDCPYLADCGGLNVREEPQRLSPTVGRTTCPCASAKPIFSTDALRMHEGFNPSGPSGAMFAEAMQVWERLWLVNFLRGLEAKNLLRAHYPLAMLIDGPLAVFGHPAWLSQSISRELCRLNAAACASGHDLLIVGVEKTGAFVDHFTALDVPDRTTGRSRIPNQTAYLLSEAYIRENIVISAGKSYGKDTYFGRKILYKTRAGARIVASLPYFCDADRDLTNTDVNRFPRLADAMSLLDAVFSVRYPNALGPLVAAHAEAAIPLNTGRRTLEQLARHLHSAS